MIVLTYLGSQCTKFHAAGCDTLFFTSFYLDSCIWTGAILWWIWQRNSECASNFEQISEKVWWRPWQWLDMCSRKKAWAIHGRSKLTETEKGETGVEQSQEHDQYFLRHRSFIKKNRLGTPNSQFCILLWLLQRLSENVQRLCPELATGCCIHDNAPPSHTSSSTREFLTKSNMILVPHPTHFSLVPWLKKNLKCRHFYTNEVIEAES
jgi:hypothetical protein